MENLTCAPYDPYSRTRFTVTVMSSIFAIVGIITNLSITFALIQLSKKPVRQMRFIGKFTQNEEPDNIITYEFSKEGERFKVDRPVVIENWKHSNYLYLIFLSLLDAGTCLSYVLLYALDSISLYLRISVVFRLYFKLIVFAYTFSRILEFAIPYLYIAATLEKWAASAGGRKRKKFAKFISSDKMRWTLVGITCMMALMFRLPSAWALYIQEFPNCTDVFGTLQVAQSEIALKPFYILVDFYVANAFGVFVPFLLLLALNITILNNTRSGVTQRTLVLTVDKFFGISAITNNSSSTLRNNPNALSLEEQERRRLKQAKQTTLSIIFLVSSYLLCTTPSFVLTVMEYFFNDIIQNEQLQSGDIYLLWSDLVSIMVMVNSFLSAFILYICNEQIRNVLKLTNRS